MSENRDMLNKKGMIKIEEKKWKQLKAGVKAWWESNLMTCESGLMDEVKADDKSKRINDTPIKVNSNSN